jgi:integrase/recombinase XerD
VLTAEDTRHLRDSIDVTTLSGLRDRALIAAMVYSFARIGAVVAMDVDDYFQQGKRWWFRPHEKGGKRHDLPAHHQAQEYLDAYLTAAGIAEAKGTALFRALDRNGHLGDGRLERRRALKMVKRRAKHAGLPSSVCCHSFRATGITTYLLNGGTLEHAPQIAAHSSPRTTKLYDRTSDDVSVDEIEKILI